MLNIDDKLLLVNKMIGLEADFVPKPLMIPGVPFCFEEDVDKRYMRRDAAKALEEMFQGAYNEGITLIGVSGYRSYIRQQEIYEANIRLKGLEHTDRYSAKPGHSEHQTGLAMDVTCMDYFGELEEDFAYTKEGKWLEKNCYKYGFIIRYPKGREENTGYGYEPWHVRYVGRKAASYIFKYQIILEEYCKFFF